MILSIEVTAPGILIFTWISNCIDNPCKSAALRDPKRHGIHDSDQQHRNRALLSSTIVNSRMFNGTPITLKRGRRITILIVKRYVQQHEEWGAEGGGCCFIYSRCPVFLEFPSKGHHLIVRASEFRLIEENISEVRSCFQCWIHHEVARAQDTRGYIVKSVNVLRDCCGTSRMRHKIIRG